MFYWMCLLTAWLACLLIAIQDFKYREIHVFALLLFGICGAGIRYPQWGEYFWSNFMGNVLMILFLLGAVLLLYRIKDGQKVMDVRLGWGDIVMLLTLATWLQPFQFVVFYTLSSGLLALCFGLFRRAGWVGEEYPIPLAGFLAIAFLMMSLVEQSPLGTHYAFFGS